MGQRQLQGGEIMRSALEHRQDVAVDQFLQEQAEPDAAQRADGDSGQDDGEGELVLADNQLEESASCRLGILGLLAETHLWHYRTPLF